MQYRLVTADILQKEFSVRKQLLKKIVRELEIMRELEMTIFKIQVQNES